MTVEKFVKFLNAEKERALGKIEKIDSVIKNCDDYLFFLGVDEFDDDGNDCENDISIFMDSVKENMEFWRGKRNNRRYAEQEAVMQYIEKYNAVK